MIHCEFENGNNASLRHVVVDVLVLKDGKILLVKRADKLTEGGKWAVVALDHYQDIQAYLTIKNE